MNKKKLEEIKEYLKKIQGDEPKSHLSAGVEGLLISILEAILAEN